MYQTAYILITIFSSEIYQVVNLGFCVYIRLWFWKRRLVGMVCNTHESPYHLILYLLIHALDFLMYIYIYICILILFPFLFSRVILQNRFSVSSLLVPVDFITLELLCPVICFICIGHSVIVMYEFTMFWLTLHSDPSYPRFESCLSCPVKL